MIHRPYLNYRVQRLKAFLLLSKQIKNLTTEQIVLHLIFIEKIQ